MAFAKIIKAFTKIIKVLQKNIMKKPLN